MTDAAMRPRRGWAFVVLLALAAVVSCDGSTSAADRGSVVRGPVTSSVPSGTPDLDSPQVLAEDLDVPWGLTFLPGGDALIAERDSGRILRLTAGSGDPDNRVVRFRLDGGQPEVLVDGIANASFHNGGRIAFGPDRMLYIGTGDAGNTTRSQDRESLNGKILRVTPDGDPAPGNPEAGSRVYSLGHRNVQGLAWDSAGRLFATEFGQNEVDEVNLIQAGRNYGWPQVEGDGDTDGGRYTDPLLTWPVGDASPSGIAISGRTAYVAALRGERLWEVPLDAASVGRPSSELEERYGRLRTVQVAPDGALWVTTSNTDGRGDVRDGDDLILRFPAR
jgi:glucose/arabinose dehydrogenase